MVFQERRRQVLESTVVTKTTLEAIMALSDSALVTTDSQHLMTMFGLGAQQTFGYTEDEVVGRSLDILMPDHLRAGYMQRLQEFIDSTDTFSFAEDIPAVRLKRKNGEEFPVEASAVKLSLAGVGPIALIRMRDISARVEGIRSLTTLKAIINLSDEAVITLDQDRRITRFNPAAERMFGYSEGEIIGHSYDDLVPSDERDARRKKIEDFLKPRFTSATVRGNTPLVMVRKNGEKFYAEGGISVFAVDGEPVIVARLTDVSEKLKAEDMRVRLRAAEESAALKSRLISTVSHELRSPLSAILGFTSLLLEYDGQLGDDERRQQLRVIEESTRHLQRIVDDLLVLSRLEGGVLDIDLQPLALQTVFDSILASFRLASGNRIKLVPPDTQLAVLGDRARLRQVLSNLINNAIKYSPPGGEIEIHTKLEHDLVSITVRDHGPGVRPEETELIFESFYRGSNAGTSDEIKSAGLGLAICKGFVEAHGGQIKAELPEDGGLAVTFTLPAVKTDGNTMYFDHLPSVSDAS